MRKLGYPPAMVRMRIVIAGLLAFALLIGPGWQPCIALQQNHHTSVPTMDAALHQGHAHHHMVTDQTAATGKDREAGREDVCQKCCAACIPTSILPRGPESLWAPAVSRISFAPPDARLRGRFVFVDPDIPKSRHVI
jgi:hypothetical protein